MKLQQVDVVENISPEEFKQKYYLPEKPLVIKKLSAEWAALQKWNWDYFIGKAGHHKVGVYNNIKSDAYTPVNKADDYMLFGDYLREVKKGNLALRIFLFNILEHCPELTQDFTFPEHLMKGFVKGYPMLFVGGGGSITHMHFDIDLSHILHTQFVGRKRVLLFPFHEQHKLYRKPWEVLSLADFTNYYEKFNYEQFPATKYAQGYEVILEHGDTLFMPSGYWHHMEYLESGFALSLRALHSSLKVKLKGAWNLFGMRYVDTFMKKTAPHFWFNYKKRKIYKRAEKVLK
ncbi:MAG: cupin-like domain-containing protein [Raineya sp.]|nr:cupin-like domain-containing protein [Raineya sp.]MDW8297598.1 cupin-like domain-containing protein [Raineya sp.]